MIIENVMTKDLISLESSNNCTQAAKKMAEYNIGSVLVTKNSSLSGIITDRDIITRCVAQDLNPSECTLDEYSSSDPITVTPLTSVSDAAEIMANNQIRRLPVLENGQLVGIVTLGDLAVDASEEADVEETLEEISVPTR